MPGMPDGFAQLIARKYDILQQQADASSAAAKASSALDQARANLIPKQGAADIAKTGADTAFTKIQSQWFGPTAQAQIGLIGAQGGLAKAQTTGTEAETTGVNLINRQRDTGFGALRPTLPSLNGLGFRFGSLLP